MVAPNDEFLQRVSEIMDSKLSSFEQKISKQQKQQHEQQLSRIQAANSKTFVFKRKGIEAQYKFNNSVREKMIEVNTSLSEENQKWPSTAFRQHELASDEEDEKPIFKAEIKAEKKLKEERIQ
uniref:Uncharacterized protein n=1 Tax=Magallana gigas TaxID=29159 RepID=A0A8W8IQN7_MAGGI